MDKIKAKLTALFMAICCCLACLGVATLQSMDEKVTATAEELEKEFTGGKFTLEQGEHTVHTLGSLTVRSDVGGATNA